MKKGNVGREGSIELSLKIMWAPSKQYVGPCGSHLNSTWDPHEQCTGPTGTRVNSARAHMNSARAPRGQNCWDLYVTLEWFKVFDNFLNMY